MSTDELSPHDRDEVEKFREFLKYLRDNPTVSRKDAYAAIYGEVLFDTKPENP